MQSSYEHLQCMLLSCFLFIHCHSQLVQQDGSAIEFKAGNVRVRRNGGCPQSSMCRSKWGYCGHGVAYCGEGCQAGPCFSRSRSSQDIINKDNFRCVFNGLRDDKRSSYLNALEKSGWKPENKDEAAVFLAHVHHETDGLKTLTEYCAPNCGSSYSDSWCAVKAVPGKSYYGRGWFQISYPCNYHAAGKSLGVDLLRNPDLVSQRPDIAIKTALWFFQSNNMVTPARQGDFASTTRIINGPQECSGGPGAANQKARVATYKRVRNCFGLGNPNRNPVC